MGTMCVRAVYRSCRNTQQVWNMRHRSIIAPAIALVGSLVLAGGVAAGGWAQATLDAAVPPPKAGEPFEVGFTLYQHGVTPVNTGNVIVLATAPDGRQLSFAGRRSGGEAHWTATVTLPDAGSWEWRIALPNQLEVQPSSFGSLQVIAAPAGSHEASNILAVLVALLGAALLTLVLWRGPRVRRIRFATRQTQRP
jgi:hypothetical protein